jgi:NitT/TauT family transport system substrate-binding protein
MSRIPVFSLKSGMLFSAIMAMIAVLLMPGAANAQNLTKASLRLKWLASAQFLGYYVAKEKGWYAAEGLDLTINPGGPNIIGENLVGAGTDTFGHAGGAASLLQARSKGLPIIGIAMLFQETPYRLVALPKSGIKDFKQFEGKTISTWFTGPQFIVQALVKSQGIPIDKVKIQAQAASMEPFLQGQVDIATVTSYNELQVLRRAGVKDLQIFNPADVGINLPNEVLIVNETFAAANPKLVQGFLNASLRGWVYAINNKKESIDILMKSLPGGNRVDQEDEMEEIPKLMLYGEAKTKGIGYIDVKALEFTNKFLVDNGVLSNLIDVNKAINLTFWEQVLAANKIVKQ